MWMKRVCVSRYQENVTAGEPVIEHALCYTMILRIKWYLREYQFITILIIISTHGYYRSTIEQKQPRRSMTSLFVQFFYSSILLSVLSHFFQGYTFSINSIFVKTALLLSFCYKSFAVFTQHDVPILSIFLLFYFTVCLQPFLFRATCFLY